MEAANRFLRDEYLPQHNKRFSVPSEEEDSAFIPWVGQGLEDILSVQEERTVGNDNTVRCKGLCLQIRKDKHRYHYVRVKVRVHEYPDGSLAIFHGPRRPTNYTPGRELIAKKIKDLAA